MFDKQTVQLLKGPRHDRCFVCHQLKFAIASQVLIHKTSGRPYCRWICKDCGKRRGLHPTAEYLQNFREMDQEVEAEEASKDIDPKTELQVLAQAV